MRLASLSSTSRCFWRYALRSMPGRLFEGLTISIRVIRWWPRVGSRISTNWCRSGWVRTGERGRNEYLSGSGLRRRFLAARLHRVEVNVQPVQHRGQRDGVTPQRPGEGAEALLRLLPVRLLAGELPQAGEVLQGHAVA